MRRRLHACARGVHAATHRATHRSERNHARTHTRTRTRARAHAPLPAGDTGEGSLLKAFSSISALTPNSSAMARTRPSVPSTVSPLSRRRLIVASALAGTTLFFSPAVKRVTACVVRTSAFAFSPFQPNTRASRAPNTCKLAKMVR